MKKPILIAVLCCALPLAVIFFYSGGFTDHSSMKQQPENKRVDASVGDTAPDFSFQTIEGETISLSSLKGESVIFTFVLTVGCTPCQITAATILEAQKQASFKVIILAVNPRETTADLKNFRNNFGSPDWLIGFDKDTSIADLYNARVIDTKLIVDAKGKIIYRDNGATIKTQTLIDKIKTQ